MLMKLTAGKHVVLTNPLFLPVNNTSFAQSFANFEPDN